MLKPLRLGVSGSSFAYVMPRELALAAYASGGGRPCKFDQRQNALMAEFMRDMMRTMNELPIESMECYHSLSWDKDPILDIMLDSPNVEFWSVHAPYGKYADPSSPDDDIRRNALRGCADAVRLASKLGAKVVVAHPGANVQYDTPKQARLELAAGVLSQVADLAGEAGIKIAVEPLPKDEPGNSLDQVLWLIDQIAHPNVGVNFDVNHLFPPNAIPELIGAAGERIVNVHVSDQDGVERHWLPMSGLLDWRAILDALVDVGYSGPLIYETHLKDQSDCAGVGRAIVENYERLIATVPEPITP